jgi:hypothetical protein
LSFCPFSKRKRTKGQTTQWPKEKGQKDRQHNGQKKKDKRTDSTMAKRKRTKGQTTLLLNGRLKDNNAPEGIKVTIVTGIYIIHHKLLVEFVLLDL